jgi:hypothetical protein
LPEKLLAASKWSDFFFSKTDHITAHITRDRFPGFSSHRTHSETSLVCDPARSFVTPTFVFPILTWQIGHLLVDVLEPLYNAMINAYG